MQFSFDREILIKILEAVELKGKYFSTGSLKSDSLGEYVKIVAVKSNHIMGYFLMNGDNQTFISCYIPYLIEDEQANQEPVVLEIQKLMKYLKTMTGDINFEINEVCTISSNNKKASIPVSLVHPNDIALSRLFQISNDFSFTEELIPITWDKKELIDSGFQMQGKKLSKIISSCESVGHGLYTFSHSNNTLKICSTLGNEFYSETIENVTSMGEADVTFTSPIHKALNDDTYNVYFNNNSLIVLVSGFRKIVRAPYVVVE
tara:strand:- start:782 stop:1564 length:783 start_codon:yes stop_codon:yes gene_type:complete